MSVTADALLTQKPVAKKPAAPPVEAKRSRMPEPVRPSVVDPNTARPFTLDQELKVFGKWSAEPVWVPPKECSEEMAESMLVQDGWFQSLKTRWSRHADTHRDQFTQVREIELAKASIRLPKGKLFVQITEKQNFDEITDEIPACVQTRLDEFMAGPGKQKGVKVVYLKPLCVEMDDQLYFTSAKSLMKAIAKIEEEVFSHYRLMYLPRRIQQGFAKAWDTVTAVPRWIIRSAVERQKRAIDAYQAKLEFERRKTALAALQAHQDCRTNNVEFNEMLALCNPLERADVIGQYSIEQELTKAKQRELLKMAAGQLPWYAAFSMGIGGIGAIGSFVLAWSAPVVVCDPAFVAEFPDSPGTLWNIGHFDDVGGVRHVEI